MNEIDMTNNNQTWEEQIKARTVVNNLANAKGLPDLPSILFEALENDITKLLQTQKLELLNKLEEELPKSNKHYWLDGKEQDLIYRQQVINLLNKHNGIHGGKNGQ